MRALLLVLVACGSQPHHPMTTVTTEGAITDAWTHGIHVIVKRNPGSETTVTNLYLRGGVSNWTATDAGIEGLALRTAVDGGTEKWPKDAFTQRLSELGSTLYATSDEDMSSLQAWSLTPAWDQTFEMLASAFLAPALPPDQIELERQRALASLAEEQSDLDSLLELRLHAIEFEGSPYANRAVGTTESVTKLTADQLRAHLSKLRDPARMVIVVVGDVDPARVIAATNQYFAQLPTGAYRELPLPPIADRPGRVTTFEKAIPTNYISAAAIGPAWGSSDFFVGWVAMSALGVREFEEVRTKRNLSYAPSAHMVWATQLPRVNLYVTAVDPTATMAVMLGEAKRLRDEPIPDIELDGYKSTLVTSRVMATEDAAGQANYLAIAQIVGGDWHLLQDLSTKIHAVTAAQIQTWARAHLAKFQTVMIGDPAKLDRAALESF